MSTKHCDGQITGFLSGRIEDYCLFNSLECSQRVDMCKILILKLFFWNFDFLGISSKNSKNVNFVLNSIPKYSVLYYLPATGIK